MSVEGQSQGVDVALHSRRLKLCLAASGGGHLRQIVDLESVWSKHDYFIVTENTILGQSLSERHTVHYLPHFGWGQVKLGKRLLMLRSALKNFIASAALIFRERPDMVISTGAGAVYFVVLWSRLLGARIVTIESFARFERASLFGQMTAPFAHDQVVQSAALAAQFPKAHYFDPLVILDKIAGPKKNLLFATVGAVLPFDRLVSAISELKAAGRITEEVIVQTGDAGAKPDGINCVDTMPFDAIQNLLRDASIVVCHGGTGSIITALREGCHVVVMPRLGRFGEVYDDHQAEITEAFEKRGLVQSAFDAESLAVALKATQGRQRVVATTDPVALREFLGSVINQVLSRKATK
jgi:UDP-N-acetylglucosamine--N-acetylmuramyl-(pentapeptide) pyrophosphoryl-undecaprenol N-acetylglucosamine transferase